jgi:hypothetical protein
MSKKIIAILFGVLILNGSTEIHQLWKLPLLVQHYLHHRNENQSLSFITFLAIHYTDTHHPSDNDDKKDNELPFKSIGEISHLDTPLIEKRTVDAENYYLPAKPSSYYADDVPDHRAFSIFHPPRLA